MLLLAQINVSCTPAMAELLVYDCRTASEPQCI